MNLRRRIIGIDDGGYMNFRRWLFDWSKKEQCTWLGVVFGLHDMPIGLLLACAWR